MCGIAGIFDTQTTREIDQALLARMNQTQHHRGPDETGLHAEPGVGLAHKRLSIIDLSSGQQPLFNEDGSIAVVFNGEIYNFIALMTELKNLGHIFHTHSDTEVIVHAWEQWGEACVSRFRGMFAFALHDRKQQILFLARDRMGVKPLFYALLDDGSLIFGSELKVLPPIPISNATLILVQSRNILPLAMCPSHAPFTVRHSNYRPPTPSPSGAVRLGLSPNNIGT